ncbi:uncharacterized protein LOC114461495 [Gouania willdenowi]|uniref:uncharacterized protein LOC114461495 n=1 Tax=Gouania willdenowi TaxID=441366 RepID=UPI0010560E86|nr:uncharacterized protein LOC114461495 [Gouania willdenowi]
MSTARKELVWEIKKSLFRLSNTDLYEVVRSIAADSQESNKLSLSDEEGCMDYVTAYLQSSALSGLEDEGMSQLLTLHDLVRGLTSGQSVDVMIPVEPGPFTVVPDHTPQTHLSSDNTQHNIQLYSHPNMPVNTPTQSVEELKKIYEELGERLKQCEATAAPTVMPLIQQREPITHSTQQPERMFPLKDLSYLQRREFKIHGGQIGDQNSDISYSSLGKQIEEGLREGFAETEVVRGVIKIVKPGTFKDMLINNEEMTVSELKGFLRSHLGEKAMTEMFQELMCSRQAEQESPQQFLYRMIGLKQKLLSQSKQASTGISYDPKTIQEVFLHTVYQGLSAKHADLRQRLRPLISNSQVTDEAILCQVVKIISDENEHLRRLGQTPRQKTIYAHSAKVETEAKPSNDKLRDTTMDSKDRQTIQQLSVQVETLTHMVAALMDQQTSNAHATRPLIAPVPHHHQLQTPPQLLSSKPPQHLLRPSPTQVKGRTARCPRCTEQDLLECSHCFVCGEVGHRAVGCLMRTKSQGNGIRSLPRDSQRPVHSPSPSQ